MYHDAGTSVGLQICFNCFMSVTFNSYLLQVLPFHRGLPCCTLQQTDGKLPLVLILLATRVKQASERAVPIHPGWSRADNV